MYASSDTPTMNKRKKAKSPSVFSPNSITTNLKVENLKNTYKKSKTVGMVIHIVFFVNKKDKRVAIDNHYG